MKLFKVLCVLALALAIGTIAYAETQSVKVSGDITLRTFARNNYDLDNNDPAPVDAGTESTDWATYLMSTAEVQIDADLTDNVAGVIRLINQRVWGDGLYENNIDGELGEIRAIRDVVRTRTVVPGQAAAFDVDIDLAYIELKEFLYSPLTLRIGRQDLWFGKGFIIGANLQDPNGALYAPEYTGVQSFDAIRATLDYDPWTIDAIFAKISENARRSDDDINLWGINVGYIFDEYNGEAEVYWFFRQDRNPDTGATAMVISTTNSNTSNDIHVLGGRGSFDPIEDWTVALEGAFQGGYFLGINNQDADRARSAWALDASVECRYWQDQFAWRPVVGVEYIFYSGEPNIGNRNALSNGHYGGWDPMFRGKFDTAIREFQNVFYRTAQESSPSTTNQHQILVSGTLEPTDSLTLDIKYAHFWLVEEWATVSNVNAVTGIATPENKDRNIGDEVDINLTWDYTEDVQFGLLSAFFFPGDHFGSGENDIATDLVGTVKLSF